MKSLGLDLVRVTEAAAIAASKKIGSGDKEGIDFLAVNAMRERLNEMDFSGIVSIGEGEKDEAPMLHIGEKVGSFVNKEKIYKIACDPVEGTTPTATSGPGAISVISLADDLFTTKSHYAMKLAYGPSIKEKVSLSLNDPVERTLELVSAVTGKELNEIFVCILNRPRHNKIIETLRRMNVRIKLIRDCDVTGAVAACLPDTGVDLLYGIGGMPEAVISACAIKCLNGGFECKIAHRPKDPNNNDWDIESEILYMDDLVKGECIFAATGITNGDLLNGVRFSEHGRHVTHSVFMRSASKTVRWLKVLHGN